jgi:hypothetical protein
MGTIEDTSIFVELPYLHSIFWTTPAHQLRAQASMSYLLCCKFGVERDAQWWRKAVVIKSSADCP